jgi:hypothetical protein
VVDGAAAHAAGQEAVRNPDVDRAAVPRAVGAVADRRAFTPGLAETEHVGEDCPGPLRVIQKQRDAPKPRIAASAGMSPPAQAGSFSAPATPTIAKLVPSGSLKRSTVSPNRFCGVSCGTPLSAKRCVRVPIAAAGTRKAVSKVWPTPSRPGATCAQGKKVRIVPGVPVSGVVPGSSKFTVFLTRRRPRSWV